MSEINSQTSIKTDKITEVRDNEPKYFSNTITANCVGFILEHKTAHSYFLLNNFEQ